MNNLSIIMNNIIRKRKRIIKGDVQQPSKKQKIENNFYLFFSRKIGWICNKFSYSNKKFFTSNKINIKKELAQKIEGKNGKEILKYLDNKDLLENIELKKNAEIYKNWYLYPNNTKIVYSTL